MDGAGANAGAPGSRFQDIRWVAETGSTNRDVLELAAQGDAEGIVVVADHQTAGRGRRGRTWTAPPGASLLCSVLLRPPAPVASLVTMALGLAAVEAVDLVAGVRAELKWPNDLVVADAKLAGVLAEAAWPPGSDISSGPRPPGPKDRAAVAAGIGINVNWPAGFPPEIAQVATALNVLGGRSVDRVELLGALLVRLEHHYSHLVVDEVAALREAYRRCSATLGRPIRLDLGADEVQGTAVDVDEGGRLVVDTVEGERRVFATGDVVHLRPLGSEL